ncbi:hypothetical protein ACFX13_032694 [Malus domestica]|uniref:Selenoprotein F n=2 Tax=Malus TaxID=3749 RepID=A0A498K4F5_MALDO|nr:hypothetical protein DVH24_001099 [Malus domestica]
MVPKARNESKAQTKSKTSVLFLHRVLGGETETRELEGREMGALVAAMLVVLAVAVASGASTSKEQLSTRECENLGFTGLALCSDCNSLAEYVKDQELVSDCMKCCTEDSDDSTTKITYSGAILEVCMRKLVFYPEIVGFIEEEKDRFPSVKVQYIFNSPPKLILLDDAGERKETIRIDNWKREHILQFLQGKVKPASAI